MSSDCFQFKQFCVHHDRCSMKVGTDGVLLGCWAFACDLPHSAQGPILDIGTGSGLIALMLAQRFPNASITGIDIDLPSVEQARENVAQSPFRNNMEIVHIGLEAFEAGGYQRIVSNPPFYEEDTHSKTEQMHNAKHTTALTFDALAAGVDRLLDKEGEFDVIVPYAAAERFIGVAATHGLFLVRRCDVKGSTTRPFKRSMMAFCREPRETEHTLLIIRTPQNTYSEEYTRLTQDFYL